MNVLVTHAKIMQPVLILSTSSAVTAYLDLMERSVKIVRRIFSFNCIAKYKIVSKHCLKLRLRIIVEEMICKYLYCIHNLDLELTLNSFKTK